jgi:hypothetical protein
MKKQIKIHKAVGVCMSVEEFAIEAGKLVNQPAENVEFALSFMLEEMGQVEALEFYCDTCGLTAY